MNNIDRFYSSDPTVFAQNYIKYLTEVLGRIDVGDITKFVEALLAARDRDAAVFFIGNGGSAATASHFANDLAMGTNDYAKPFRALSLCDNLPVLTATANDYGYEDIFSRQLQVQARAGDVVVGISASGNSPNLVKAFRYAKTAGIITVAITAFDGGKIHAEADLRVHVPTEKGEYGPAEDAHMMLDHLIGAYLMRLVKDQS